MYIIVYNVKILEAGSVYFCELHMCFEHVCDFMVVTTYIEINTPKAAFFNLNNR